jgi:hypothetical protein
VIHSLLLDLLRLFAQLFTHLLLVLLALRSAVLPYNLENFVGILRGNGRADPAAFEDNLDEFCLLLTVGVEIEPIIEILTAESPSVSHPFRAEKSRPLHFREQDSPRRGEGKVILANNDQLLVDSDRAITVQLFRHLNYVCDRA